MNGIIDVPPMPPVIRKWSNIPYADNSPAQQLDIYLPHAGHGPFPVIIAIHGGAFLMGDKADGQLNAPLSGVERGYAVVSINYRLSGEAIFPAAVRDVQAAIRFLKSNAARYQLDAQRFAAWGGSAGGNLAAWAGAASRTEDTRIHAVVDWFGPIDFLSMDGQFRISGLGRPNHSAIHSPESLYLGCEIAKVPELVKEANPASYLHRDIPPFFIQHGSKDPLVPTEQSVLFAEQIRGIAGSERVILEIIEGAGHGGAPFEDPENLEKVFAFLGKSLK
jgi:acetyl esterase/lipase